MRCSRRYGATMRNFHELGKEEQREVLNRPVSAEDGAQLLKAAREHLPIVATILIDCTQAMFGADVANESEQA